MDVLGLDALVESSDWRRLQAALTSLDAADLALATKWYRRSGRARARLLAEASWHTEPRVVQLLLAITLAQTPLEASKNCMWARPPFVSADPVGAMACAEALIRRDRDWVAEFVVVSAEARFRGPWNRGAGEVASVVSAAIIAHDLPYPLTDAYVRGWTSLIYSAHSYAKSDGTGHWRPLVLMTATSGAAQPAYTVGKNLTLLDCLAGTRAPTDLLVAALATPNAFHAWADFRREGWAVGPSIRYAVGQGVLDRVPLLNAAFAALSRSDRPSNQRIVSQLLEGLDPTPEEVRDRAALVLHVLPVAHGSVTKVLLEMALTAGLQDEDLVEVGTVILARKEKAQKVTLLRHLATSDSPAREPLLAMAMDSADATLATRARALLGPDGPVEGDSEAASFAGLPPWSHRVEDFQPGPFAPYAVNAAGFDQATSDLEALPGITTEAAHLDLVVKFAHRDLNQLRTLVLNAPRPSVFLHVRTPYLLRQWVETGSGTASYQHTSTSYQYNSPRAVPIVEHHTFEWLPIAHLSFVDRLVEETLARLGPLKELLSTPSRADGTLGVSDLADRVKRAQTVGYGPYDLVQALLRLGPTSASDLELFAGLALAPAERAAPERPWFSRWKRGHGTHDGVEAIRHWIGAGGRPERRVAFHALDPRTSALALPLPVWLANLAAIAGVTQPVSAWVDQRESWGGASTGPWLGVCPWDAEHVAALVATRRDVESAFQVHFLSLIEFSAGPIGPAVHHQLARVLSHPRLDSRLIAAQQVSTIALQGRLDPELFRERNEALFAGGALSLTRAAQAWSEIAALSSMATVWPTWSSLLATACSASKKPAGLADFLRLTRELAPVISGELGHDWLPAPVYSLAQGRGSTKAAVEARALVAAVHMEDV